MSQDPKTVATAESTADQIAAVVNRSMLPPARGGAPPPPVWFLAGGNALQYWLIGLVQKLFGWPVNSMLAKKFGLDRPVALE